MKKNNIFDSNSKKNKNIKYLIISFVIFLVITGFFSLFLFMKNINFDLNNLTAQDSDMSQTTTETAPSYSVSSITGKANVLYICEDVNGELKFTVTVYCDYDNKQMLVSSYDSSENNFSSIYKSSKADGLKKEIEVIQSRKIDKYAVICEDRLSDLFALFDDITVNVLTDTVYKSGSFKLELSQGKNTLSPDYLSRYLVISDSLTRSNLICDIINNIVTPKYTENSQELFKSFINMFKSTDISVIDYSEQIEKLKIYSMSEDRFLPKVQ